MTVNNLSDGSFLLSQDISKAFAPIENLSLIANKKEVIDSTSVLAVENLIIAAKEAEAFRQTNRFVCPTFPPLKVNKFVRKRFNFDIKSNGPHFYPSKPLFDLYPKDMTSKPKRKRMFSYKEYNVRCGDDSKITGHPLKAEEMFCEKCGKIGHLPEICWMKIRTSKEMGLTSKQDLVLNDFLLSLTQAPSLKPLRPDEDMITYIQKLERTLNEREQDFKNKWRTFARSYKVSADLVQPGFPQMRQGLAFWFAISCPIFILQWVASWR